MRKPKIGEFWKSKICSFRVQVTDISKKNKTDYFHGDDYFNRAPIGQVFVYGVRKTRDLYISGKIYLEDFLNKYEPIE